MARLLKLGAVGADVRALQDALNREGGGAAARLVVDGIFGAKTHARLLAFQRGAGLVPDGVVGPLVWDRLARKVQLSSGDVQIGRPRGGVTGGGKFGPKMTPGPPTPGLGPPSPGGKDGAPGKLGGGGLPGAGKDSGGKGPW
jgi:peptidoglycan hydrolase-like protein with peptidoglycan-binding domain